MTVAGRVVDCDVHCGVPTLEALTPYLARHWSDYFHEVGYKQLFGVNYTYPPWSRMLAPQEIAMSVEQLKQDVLERADVAILNAYYGVESHQHPYLVRELASAVNRWIQAEWLDCADGLFASAVIAPQYAESAVEEIRRIADDRRFVQVLLPARSWEPYGSQRYWPIWEAAAEAKLALGITYGGSSGTPQSPNGWATSVFEEYAGFQQVFAAHITSLIANGVFSRFPALKVVVMESGWTWLAGLIWRMDAEWRAARREVPWVDAPPSEYVRRHFRFTTQPIDAGADAVALRNALAQFGYDDILMFGSDYPRSYAPTIEELLAQLTSSQADRVTWATAAATYGLESRLETVARPA